MQYGLEPQSMQMSRQEFGAEWDLEAAPEKVLEEEEGAL